MGKQINREIDVTKFVNIDDKDFVFHINGSPREVKAGESKEMPIYVAEIGAKHLADRILQEKHGLKDSLKDTPLRRSIFAKIIPELQVLDEKVKALSLEEELKLVKEQLSSQAKLIEGFSEVKKSEEAKDKKLADLEAEIEKLKQGNVSSAPAKVAFCGSCASKGVRHLKTCPTLVPEPGIPTGVPEVAKV